MKLSEFHSLTSEQLESLDTPTLKKLVSEQGKKLNKRVKNIYKNSGTNKSAATGVMTSGGFFGVKGKDRKELLNEAKREQRFMDKKTSTVKGAIKVSDEISKSITGMTSKEYAKKKAAEYKKKLESEKLAKSKRGKLTRAQYKAIKKATAKFEQEAQKRFNNNIGVGWDVFHRWQERNPAYNKMYDKEKVKQTINEFAIGKDVYSSGIGKDADELMDVFNRNVEEKQKELAFATYSDKDAIWQTVDSTPFTDGSGLSPTDYMRLYK